MKSNDNNNNTYNIITDVIIIKLYFAIPTLTLDEYSYYYTLYVSTIMM